MKMKQPNDKRFRYLIVRYTTWLLHSFIIKGVKSIFNRIWQITLFVRSKQVIFMIYIIVFMYI